MLINTALLLSLVGARLALNLSNIRDITEHVANHSTHHYFAVKFHPETYDNHPSELLESSHTCDPHYAKHQKPVKAEASTHFEALAKHMEFKCNCEVVGRVGDLYNHFIVRTVKSDSSDADEDWIDVLEMLRNHEGVKWVDRQIPRKKLFKRIPQENNLNKYTDQDFEALGIKDPLFERQWHLYNRKYSLHDINVTGVWMNNVTGKGVVVSILDDGLDYNHPDLKDNYNAEGSFDFNTNSSSPLPKLKEDYHGTRCAGEIAAVRNDVCGVGVAYEAQISGIRILGAEIPDYEESLSVMYKTQVNDIYSCSWGPDDDGTHVEGPSEVIVDAMIKSIHEGRQGKGSIFVFATGNGGYNKDNCNYDGYTNSIYAISIGAIDFLNEKPPYSEECSAQYAVTYSSGNGEYIHTTDLHGGCTHQHGGTSAAAPIAAGIFALVLSVRPDLTWRDMQHLTITTADPSFDDKDLDWQNTFGGRRFNHKFGYGRIDSYKIIEAARNWSLVAPQVSIQSPTIQVNTDFSSQKDSKVDSSYEVTPEHVNSSSLHSLEYVTVTVDISHQHRGVMNIQLISPHNIISNLGPPRPHDDSIEGFKNWTFKSVKHWGEPIPGNWTLRVSNAPGTISANGTVNSWWIKFWGAGPLVNDIDKDKNVTPVTPAPPRPPIPTIPPATPALPDSSKSRELSFLSAPFFGVFGLLTVIAMSLTAVFFIWKYLVRDRVKYFRAATASLDDMRALNSDEENDNNHEDMDDFDIHSANQDKM